MFEFESKMALTTSSVVNKKRQCVAIMFIFQNRLVRLSRYLLRSLLLLVLFQSGERPAYTASLAALLEAEGSASDSGLSGSGNRLKYR